jgi:hypothetical protein
MLIGDVDLNDSSYTAGRMPGERKRSMSESIENVRADQEQASSATSAPAKKDKPLVEGSCGHFTRRGKPGQPCGPCRDKAAREAAIARRKNKARRSEPAFQRRDAQARRLPDKSRYIVEFEESTQRWTGTLDVAGVPPISDSSGGLFKLLTKLDQQYRKAVAPAPTLPVECRLCHKPLLPEHSDLTDGCPCNSPVGTNDGIPCATCGQPRRNGECQCRREASAETLQREGEAAIAATNPNR